MCPGGVESCMYAISGFVCYSCSPAAARGRQGGGRAAGPLTQHCPVRSTPPAMPPLRAPATASAPLCTRALFLGSGLFSRVAFRGDTPPPFVGCCGRRRQRHQRCSGRAPNPTPCMRHVPTHACQPMHQPQSIIGRQPLLLGQRGAAPACCLPAAGSTNQPLHCSASVTHPTPFNPPAISIGTEFAYASRARRCGFGPAAASAHTTSITQAPAVVRPRAPRRLWSCCNQHIPLFFAWLCTVRCVWMRPPCDLQAQHFACVTRSHHGPG